MLTVKQQKTLDFIRKYVQRFDCAPTTAEIAKGIGIKSRGVVHRYIKALEEAGLIALTPKRHRNIQLVADYPDEEGLPLVGMIAAGQPIQAIEQQERINVADIFLGPGRFALRVRGESMIEEGIFDGDIVVCEKRTTADNGQIVVALIDNEEATLKRLQRGNDGTVTLLPANSLLQPMVYDAARVLIQGIYVGLLRFSV